MNTKELAVSAIQNGTVIDHIKPGNALKVVRLLNLASDDKKVLIGLNLPSKKIGKKDLIKVESAEWQLSRKEASQIAILAPQATVTLIENYEPLEKYDVEIPPVLEDVLDCPNKHCITNHEKMATFFFVQPYAKTIYLQCRYCRKSFPHQQIQGYRL